MKFIYCLIILFALPAIAQQNETISWKEATINDKVKMELTKAEFDKRFKADSIAVARPDELCDYEEGASVKFVYYKGAKFELRDGIMKFRSVRFKNRSNWFSIKDDWFDFTTTLKSFIKTYPISGSIIEEHIADDGEAFDMIMILPEDPEADYEWRFYFLDDKLHSVECWSPC